MLAGFTMSLEKRLIKTQLKRYEDAGRTGRPVLKISDKIIVKVQLSLIQILDLDERNQILTTNIWMQMVSIA
ncbi:unnamed protein product [Protopolystoma xenopodis]|uniref:Neurotransmitter-gated ion-channel ligand-binding domain-containing protein n=1 Tax=Protopolystoma xenopodis TaxID=117903 RepID=A0A448WJA9_9PLAT|nr:unnamed protein product [Protopolystoma xenopodis]